MHSEQRIRERAHAIWEAEGRPEGRHDEHWERARREIEVPNPGDRAQTPHDLPPSQSRGDGRPGDGSSQGPGSQGLAGADDTDPDFIGVDDVGTETTVNPNANRPTTGRSKLVGT